VAEKAREREVKLVAWPGFRLPELDDLASWVKPQPTTEKVLEATYYDADDLRLIRAGLSLRHRLGEGGADGRWTAKIPNPNDSVGLDRTELSEDSSGREIPPELLRVLSGVLRGEKVKPVAHLQSRRRLVPLVDGGGRPVGEVADDEVSVLEDGRVAVRFREVEVEAAPAAPPALLDLVVGRLREAGAGDPDPTPKLVRALGPRALAPPDPIVAPLGHDPTAGAALQVAMASSVQRLIAHDPAVRLDLGSFGVHQARVATRRLRSNLKTFEPIIDSTWLTGLRDELKWLADALGRVRDADVLMARLGEDQGALSPADAAQVRRLLRRLERQRSGYLHDLHEVYDSERYLSLLDRLVEATRSPRLLPMGLAPADEVLPRLVTRPWRKLTKAADKLGKDAPDAELHQLRIRSKKARYAAEAAVDAMPAARPMAEALADLQGVLGDQHDAVVAQEWLRQTVTDGSSRLQALAAGLLIAVEQQQAEDGRNAWRDVVKSLERKKVHKWLD
jgi:CHAD domain-containing protein